MFTFNRKLFSSKKYQGSALVTALFVMALTVSLSVGMWFRQRVDMQRLQTILTFDELYAYSTYVEAWAVSQLQLALNNTNPDEYVSLVPTSAHTGEGLPDLMTHLTHTC